MYSSITPRSLTALTGFLLVVLAPALALAGSICGTVIDQSSQNPVAQAAVFLFDDQGSYTGIYDDTDGLGFYCLHEVVPGTYSVQVRRDDYLEAVIGGIVVEDTATDVDLNLVPGLRLAVGPNPARGRTTLAWRTRSGASLQLEVFDLAGRRLRSWFSNSAVGEGAVEFDLRDQRGLPLPAGTYLVRLDDGHSTTQRSLTILK